MRRRGVSAYGPVVLTRLISERPSVSEADIYGLAAALVSLAAAVLASALARLAGMSRESAAVIFVVVLAAIAIGAAIAGAAFLDRLRGRRREMLRRY